MFRKAPRKASRTAPGRSMSREDKTILRTSNWSTKSEMKFGDKVSIVDRHSVLLTGMVMYAGGVPFAEGTWVGVQLTGPSIGMGNCDGTYKGKGYFSNVGPKNGIMAPIDCVQLYDPEEALDPAQQLATVDILTHERVGSLLTADEINRKKLSYKEELYIDRLKEARLGNAIKEREVNANKQFKIRYSTHGTALCDSDFQFVKGLESSHQNYCLSDPTMTDNPITYASQPFLNLTGYSLSDILGRNCRFLQGDGTNRFDVNRVRQSIAEGADCHVCLLNYRKDGSTFYNRLFMTALRDTNGRIKNFIGVQCEVSESQARHINEAEERFFQAGLRRNGTKFSKRTSNGSTASMSSISSNNSVGALPKESKRSTESLLDMEEAFFRSTLEDPFAPMPEEMRELYEQIREDPFAGYTTKVSDGDESVNTVNVVEGEEAIEIEAVKRQPSWKN